MAKHAHMIKLLDGRTWKCMLDGCAFFVHMGLTHVLIGKKAICYECHEIFTVTENAINVAKQRNILICDDCIMNLVMQSIAERSEPAKPRATIKREDGMEITRGDVPPVQHTRECSVWHTDVCDCGAEYNPE